MCDSLSVTDSMFAIIGLVIYHLASISRFGPIPSNVIQPSDP